MKIPAAAFAALVLLGAARADDLGGRPYASLVEEAQAAFAAEDYSLAAARLDEAQAQRPYSNFLTRNRILARFLGGDAKGAIEIADRVAARGLALDLPNTEAFNRLRDDPAFAEVLRLFDQNRSPKGVAQIAASHPETGLVPEAIVKYRDGFLIGSVRSGAILELRAGALREILRLEGGVFDIALADKGTAVFAVVNNQLAYDRTGERPAEAAVVKADLDTGEVLWSHSIEGGDALLGDLEATARRLYLSDSLSPRIFGHDEGNKPALLSSDPRFANVQGIALDRKNDRLFVADYLTGLFVIDIASGATTQIANPSDAHLGGIDGLYLHKGDLIGVQNGTTPQRIVRIDLDRKGTVARSLTVLQQALPEWNEPTHGFVDGDRFIYIATSNWPAYDDAGAVRDGAVLQPLRLMSIDLD